MSRECKIQFDNQLSGGAIVGESDCFTDPDNAQEEADDRNAMNDGEGFRDANDWRVETFVKGD